MDLISWSSTILKSWNNSGGMTQHPSVLAAYWPWSGHQSSHSTVLDFSSFEAAAINFYRHPAIVAPLISPGSGMHDKRQQLSFGIDRILGDQVGKTGSKILLNSVSSCQFLLRLSAFLNYI